MKKFLLSSIASLFVLVASAQQFEFQHFNQATHPELRGNNFKSVAVAREGRIWAGSQYHGLFKFNPTNGIWDETVDLWDVLITDLKTDHFGNIWVSNAGRSGLQGGGSNIGGGVSHFHGLFTDPSNFYTITAPGYLTSRNARSIWVDNSRRIGNQSVVWVAQGTFISSNQTQAGGISVGKNEVSPYFTKVFEGLQVTPYVGPSQAGTPSCLSIAGNGDEVWVFALQNFGRNQILRYRADPNFRDFIGAYDNTNTPALAPGFRANAMYFDEQKRCWIGQQQGGLIIYTGSSWVNMNDPSIFPIGTVVNPNAITSAPNGFVYIGTNLGLVVYRGGPLDAASSYFRVTTTDGLPTNNINGIAVDTFAKRIVLAHSAGISFMKYKNKVNASLEWDYSFPKPQIQPKGVATDGVSRLYIKVRRNDSLALGIKKVALAMHNLSGLVSNLVGKLKLATVFDQYSNEANSGTAHEVSRTDSTPNGDFFFWYVAPDDFAKDSLSPEAQMMEREDSIKVKITYSDNSEDSSYISVKLQRPPLMVGSMLSRIGKSLQGVLQTVNGMPLLKHESILLKLGHLVNANGSLMENVSRLIDGDLMQNEDKERSLQGMAEAFRNMGYASNRVDVVGHGLFGNIARLAASIKVDKFFADGNHVYNNYGKGFYNKFISINTPHNGSPIADLMKSFAPLLNTLQTSMLGSMFQKNPDTANVPYPFLKFSDSITLNSELIRKALMGLEGLKLPASPFKNHLIVSNVELDPANPKPFKSKGFFGGIANIMHMVVRDASPQLKAMLTQSMDSINSGLFKSLNMVNLFASTKGIFEFTKNSDLFSDLASQAAGQALTLPHITKVTSSDSVDHVSHDGILGLKGLGTKIINLINTSMSNGLFSDMIPANNLLLSSTPFLSKALRILFDTTKVVTDDRQVLINQNLRTASDPTIVLKFRVKDTVGLQYVYINFQDSIYTTTSKARDQQMTLKIRKAMAYSGVQQLQAVGVYETADSILYHADTIRTYVTPPVIQGFRVKAEEVELFDEINYNPTYEVKVNGQWEDLPSSDTGIAIVIQRPNVLAYDEDALEFSAVSDGFSKAYFTYQTYKDTVSFATLLSLRQSAINRTLVNGSFTDSATWSKGRPPLTGDSIIISAAHNIVLNTSVQVRALRIEQGGSLSLSGAHTLTLGGPEDGDFMLDNFGTLNISNGTLTVRGRVKLNAGSTFNMTGGTLVIDGNTGHVISSLADGAYLFEAAPGMSSFSFTGGILQIVDPPIGVASQAINCPYPFGVNSTLMLGNGVSQTASNNPSGFGGSLFPPAIGRLVIDAGTAGSNRQFTITKPLNVKGTLTVKSGSHLKLEAALTIDQ